MPGIEFTAEQRRAIATIDRSVVVSAAAGSGKTAVLAARCAYLVADAPPPFRCDVDRLLVLTFTDAAAAEMRSRIVENLRARAEMRPDDERLRTQTLLVEGAHISTIHAFCLWICRRWFSDLGIDPHAPLLDEEEARVLRREVLDDVFERLYDPQRDPLVLLAGDGAAWPNGAGSATADHFPEASSSDSPRRATTDRNGNNALGDAFARLVDDYGLGRDRDIARLVLALHDYAASLPDPQTWFQAARAAVSNNADETILALGESLSEELLRQMEHVERIQRRLAAMPPIAQPYLSPISIYLLDLRAWSETLSEGRGSADRERFRDAKARHAALAALGKVCTAIGAYEFPKAPSSRLGKDTPAEITAARDLAKGYWNRIRDQLFRRRLKGAFALFTLAEWRDGLQRIAPYVDTLIGLVDRYAQAYDRRKRQLDVLDFSDLERMALQLLSADGAPEKPSPIAQLLRQRFAHVLVDEFQDINPIQRAIVQLVSREGDPDRSSNLFVVGDVKQSIYRFRLGEPEIFVQRWEEFRRSADGAGAMALRWNFRSRPEVIDAVNRVFRELMRPGRGSIAYDESAQLRPGRVDDPGAAPAPVELHLVERRVSAQTESGEPSAAEDREERSPGFDDPLRWNAAEREAYVIGMRIQEMLATQTIRPGGESLSYRHCVVLLRAARVAAEQMVRVFGALGIPAHADAGASLFEAREVRDVLAALHVLDNRRQDIPLAAVLRSGIFGEALDADELVAVRGQQSHAAFHLGVLDYAERGSDAGLRERLSRLCARIDAYRHDIRCRPVAETLWNLYERYGFLSHVCGLPDGLQRRANLLKLHELAGRFGGFRRQGLHRFLLFIESFQEQERDLATASPVGPAEDVVRIMTVHQSKGLEFPVVFLAGLGNKFNFRDRSGRMIFERSAHIGLRVVVPQRRVEYASAAHRLVVEETERRAREEEMRILYVAMTRARDKLILVGSRAYLDRAFDRWSAEADGEGLDTWEILTAGSALEWIAPVLMAAGKSQVHTYGAKEMVRWHVSAASSRVDPATLAAVANLAPLPITDADRWDEPEADRIIHRLNFTYRALALTSVPSVQSASALKGVWTDPPAPDEPRKAAQQGAGEFPPVDPAGRSAAEEAAQRGILTHRVLQHLDFERARDDKNLSQEIERMVGAGIIKREERLWVDAEAIAWFVQTPLADAIREAGAAFRREFSYMARQAPRWFDSTVGVALDAEDYVLVRGIIDGILPTGGKIEIIDYKTDRVAAAALPRRVREYQPQMTLYAAAAARLWRRPVAKVRLVFLTPRQLVDVDW